MEVCGTLKAIADLGLTVVAVIHQPRIEIFRSFDELLLLAPGGITVYAGPQKAVLPYFRSLGFTFQLGVNPADDLLDFVAGSGPGVQGFLDSAASREGSDVPSAPSSPSRPPRLVIPAASASQPASAASAVAMALVAHWLEHGAAFRASLRQEANEPITPFEVSPAGEVEGEEGASGAFDPTRLTAERGAPFLTQVSLCHTRALVQQYRTAGSYVLEMCVGILAGAIMGSAAMQLPELYVGVLKPPYTLLSPSPLETLLPSIGMYVALAVGISGAPAGVRTFGEEKDVYYREVASGHSALAYYIAKSWAQVYRFTLGSLHFTAIFHLLASPATDFGTMYAIVFCQYFAVYGLSALMSMLVSRENSALLGVIVALIAGCLCGFGPSLKQGREWGVGWVFDSSHARWANEAWFDQETTFYRDTYMVAEVSAPLFGYTLDRYGFDIFAMLAIGLAHRTLAFGFLVGLNRDKQR